jgi:hypothetical protein
MSVTGTLTAAVIKGCFARAIDGKRRWSIPTDEQCDSIAQQVSKDLRQIGKNVSPPSLGAEAKKYARLFLKHLPVAREVIDAQYRDAEWLYASVKENPYFQGIVELEIAQQAVAAILDRYGSEKSRFIGWHDLANWIAVYAMEAWRETGQEPKAVGSDQPLCLFVHNVLKAVGINQAEDSVQEALRFRRGRPGHKSKAQKVGGIVSIKRP